MTTYAALPQLVVDGSPLDATLQATLARVEIDERLGLPTMVSIRLRDAARDIGERAGLKIGAVVEVQAGRLGEAPGAVLGAAEIVSLEVSYSQDGNTLTARGYDVSHRLHRFRRTRTYEQVTDGDVLRSVAEEAGLQVGDVDDPGVVHPHLAQLNTTDWDFLSARARESGRVLRVRDGALELAARSQASAAPQPGSLSSQEAGQLVLGTNVQSWTARVSSAELPSEIEVRGWSADSKEPIVAVAPVSASGIEIGVTPADLAGGTVTLSTVDRAVASQEEADALARAQGETVGGGFATARAVCLGDPRLRAGTPVSVAHAGELFSGRWTVHAARHSFDLEGYRTTVDLGDSGDGLLDPRAAGSRHGGSRPPVEGVVTGVVTDIGDDDELARVRVSLPWLSDEYVSDWVRVVQAGAGEERGTMMLPEVDDEVLLAFEQGDVRRPFVLGGLYNGQDRPPLDAGAVDASAGESQRRGLVSRLGHQVVLDDGTETPGIVLVTGGGAVQIVLDDAATDLTVTAEGDVHVTSGGTVSVAGRSVELTGDAEVSVKAPGITVEADGTLTLKGSVVQIN